MLETNITKYIYAASTPLSQAMSDLYRRALTICLVCDKKGVLLGVLTRSDIKQALLKGVDPRASVSTIMNTNFTSAPKGTPLTALKKLALKMTKEGLGPLLKIPIVDAKKKLVGLYILPEKHQKEIPTVLITGGAGYLGSHLSRQLLGEGYRVVALDKLLFGDAGIRDIKKNNNFTLIEGDIGDIGVALEAVQHADSVVHLAGIVGDPASALRPMQTMEENHFATKMLINLCEHYLVSRFVFASSCSVYGAHKARLHEKSKTHPVSLYAQSKLYSERELLRAAGEHFHPVILRFGTLYGYSPRMRFDLVVNTMAAHGYFTKKITVDGGTQWRPLLHVEDAARACLRALEAPLKRVSGEIFNVGDSSENYQIAQIAEEVKRHIPQAAINHLDTVKDRRDYNVSFQKINRVMQFKTKHSLPEKIGEIVAQFKKGKLKDWKDKKYNNYLTLRSALEESSL
jgi:nucleoside-diphosphate-sugar epimerase